MRIILFLLITSLTLTVSGQSEEQKILDQAKKFSEYLMTDEKEKVVAMYTADAKIFPGDRDILEGNDLEDYWNPETPSSWQISFHKITHLEVKVWGDEAYDYGYYEGISTNGEQTANWKGKYVIIWRKEGGEWKIYLDIWNRIKSED